MLHGRYFYLNRLSLKEYCFKIVGEILTLQNGKKEKNVFSFAGIEFNLITSNAELLLLSCCFFVEGDEFVSLHYSNWERFRVDFFFTHWSLRFSRLSMSQYSKLKSNYAPSRRRAKW